MPDIKAHFKSIVMKSGTLGENNTLEPKMVY